MKLNFPHLHDLTTSEAAKLEELPGLRVSTDTAWGTFDAFNAALLRLGKDTFRFREAYPQVKPIDLPVKKHLRDYQVYGVRWLSRRLLATGGALLADDMGLGKTLQAITLMRRLVTEQGGRVLVICPKPALLTWKEEWLKWGSGTACTILPTVSKWDLAQKASVVLCSYDHRVLDRTIDNAFVDAWPDMIVFDEFHRARGRKSLRSKKLKELAPLARYRLGLTGTPQYDRPRDFYTQLHILWPKGWGSQWDFDKAYCGGKQGTHGFENKGVSRGEELKARLSNLMLRRLKVDVAKELPALTRQVRWIDPTPEAVRAYSAAAIGWGKSSLHKALVATLKGKMEEAVELAVEARRFLLFTWMKEHAHYFAKRLALEEDTPCVLITGDLSLKQREAAIAEARTKRCGIVATLDSASEALNLQGVASVGIMHYLSFEPNKVRQAEDRLHRIGAVDPVVWYYLAMRDSADKIVLSTVVDKLDQWSKTMDSSRRDLRHTLGDAVDGEAAQLNEAEVLSALYAAMKG